MCGAHCHAYLTLEPVKRIAESTVSGNPAYSPVETLVQFVVTFHVALRHRYLVCLHNGAELSTVLLRQPLAGETAGQPFQNLPKRVDLH